jgi:hypothetical protein
MRHLTFVLLAVLVVTLAGSAAAQTGIGLVPSSFNAVTFTGGSNVMLGSCLGGSCTLSGFAMFNSGSMGSYAVGVYTFSTNTSLGNVTYSATANPSVWNLSNGSAVTTFSFAVGADTWMTAHVTWTYVVDSSKPQLNATLSGITINTSAASAAFQALFGNVNTIALDLTLNTMTCSGLTGGNNCTIAGIHNSGGLAQGGNTISSGEEIPEPVPEPTSLALVGSGLFAASVAARNRIKRNRGV